MTTIQDLPQYAHLLKSTASCHGKDGRLYKIKSSYRRFASSS